MTCSTPARLLPAAVEDDYLAAREVGHVALHDIWDFSRSTEREATVRKTARLTRSVRRGLCPLARRVAASKMTMTRAPVCLTQSADAEFGLKAAQFFLYALFSWSVPP